MGFCRGLSVGFVDDLQGVCRSGFGVGFRRGFVTGICRGFWKGFAGQVWGWDLQGVC